MANKVTKILNYTSSNNTGWETTDKGFFTNEEDLTRLPDPGNANSTPRVAVPSPYARFELMEKAFQNVAKSREKADERDQLLVSQTLDILQLIFEGSSTAELDVVEWNLETETEELISKGEKKYDRSPGMLLYGRTLREYASRENYGLSGYEDKDISNSLYILRLNDRALAMTCPTSVILPTPNFRDMVWNEFALEGNKIPLFSKTRALYERPKDFILYLYQWTFNFKLKSDNGIPPFFKGFDSYIEDQKKIIGDHGHKGYDQRLYDILDNLTAVDFESDYNIASINGKRISVMGFPLYQLKREKIAATVKENSDLIIDSKLRPDCAALVLSNNIPETTDSGKKWRYTSDNTFWDSKNSGLDYSDKKIWDNPYNKRTILPNGVEFKHGYLSEHDFLSDQLWKLPYLLDDKFETVRANIETDDYSFLPPVTPLYFEFFTTDDLQKYLSFEILQSGTVTAKLRIPLAGGNYVTLEKTYMETDSEQPVPIEDILRSNLSVQKFANGTIIQVPVALNIFPFVRFADRQKCDYALQLVKEIDYSSKSELSLNLYAEEENGYKSFIEENKKFRVTVRHEDEGQATVQAISVRKTSFELIEFIISVGSYKTSAFLIPKWGRDYRGVNPGMTFAFDFGTSNTYVAVSTQEGMEELTLPMNLLVSTISSNVVSADLTITNFENWKHQEMLPYSRKDTAFPIASVLSIPKFIDKITRSREECPTPLLNNCIPFLYGYEDYGKDANRIKGNLKWLYTSNDNDAKHAGAFITELMMIARAFAISRDVKLEECKILWTYPLSFSSQKFDQFEKLWKNAFKLYFSDKEEKDRVIAIPESVAPALVKNKVNGLRVSIDIGGGTCDLVISNSQSKNKDWKLASFTFGAENIFGLEDETSVSEVPMISEALSSISEILKISRGENLIFAKVIQDLMDQLPNSKTKLSEATRLLFGLPDNSLLQKIEIADAVSLNKWLQRNSKYRHIFLYYYAAIIYYIAKLIEACDFEELPEEISFSGSGSKLVHILSQESNRTLRKLSSLLFQTFAPSLEEVEDLRIRMESEPKKITAKGALSETEQRSKFDDIDKAKKYERKYFLIKDIDKNKSTSLKVEVLQEDYIDEAVEGIIDFNNKFESFIKKYGNEFEIDLDETKIFLNSMKRNDEWNSKRIRRSLNTFLNGDGISPDDEITDAPFFIGIKDLLYRELTRNDEED